VFAAEATRHLHFQGLQPIAGRAGTYDACLIEGGHPLFHQSRKRKTTGIAVLVAATAAAFGAYAFTASNTVPTEDAGGGAGAVSGYTVTNPAYTFSADGTTVTAVAFNLDKAASDVEVALTGTPVHADWQDCGAATGSAAPYDVSCTFTTPVANANHTALNVIAVSSGTATIAP
jgi:hypothetical protein